MRGLKGVLISAVLLSSAVARADFSFKSLHVEKDGTFELVLNTPKGPAVFKDRDLQANGQTVTKTAGSVSVDLVRYSDHPLVTAAVTVTGIMNGAVFILKGDEKGDFTALNTKAIVGKASSLAVDFADVLEALGRIKGKDSSLVLEALANHFNENPSDDLFAYAESFENGIDAAMREKQKQAAEAEAAENARRTKSPAASEDQGGPVAQRDEQDEASPDEEPPPQPRRERVKIRRVPRPQQGYGQPQYYGYPPPPGYGNPYYNGGYGGGPSPWGW